MKLSRSEMKKNEHNLTEIVKSEMNFESKTTVGRDFTLSQIEGFHILPDIVRLQLYF